MIRVAGVTLPNKRMEIALSYIYGVGVPKARALLKEAGVSYDKKPDQLTEEEVKKVRDSMKDMILEGDLRRKVMLDVRRMKEINCYRGLRHAKGLPVRGQKTKTNSRTCRGNKRVTMGSGRKDKGQKT